MLRNKPDASFAAHSVTAMYPRIGWRCHLLLTLLTHILRLACHSALCDVFKLAHFNNSLSLSAACAETPPSMGSRALISAAVACISAIVSCSCSTSDRVCGQETVHAPRPRMTAPDSSSSGISALMRVCNVDSQDTGTSSRVAMSGNQCASGRVMVLVVMCVSPFKIGPQRGPIYSPSNPRLTCRAHGLLRTSFRQIHRATFCHVVIQPRTALSNQSSDAPAVKRHQTRTKTRRLAIDQFNVSCTQQTNNVIPFIRLHITHGRERLDGMNHRMRFRQIKLRLLVDVRHSTINIIQILLQTRHVKLVDESHVTRHGHLNFTRITSDFICQIRAIKIVNTRGKQRSIAISHDLPFRFIEYYFCDVVFINSCNAIKRWASSSATAANS